MPFICNRCFFEYTCITFIPYTLMKEKFIYNIKILFVGIALWWIIFAYLQEHPGEKQSILPSLQTLYHKWQIFFYTLLGEDSTSIQTKQSLQKMYSEISYLIESSKCDDIALIQEVEENRTAIQALDYSQAQNNKYNYYLKAVDLKNKIEKQCTVWIATSTGDIIISTGTTDTGTSL